MNEELGEKYLIEKVEAALFEALTPLAVRQFFPLADGEPETPELRQRMANIKARLIVGKLADQILNALYEGGVFHVENFLKLEGSHRLENKLNGKPGGSLYPVSTLSGPVFLSQIATRRIEAYEVPGNYHGEPLADSYVFPAWDYVSWAGGSSPDLGGNNEDSAIGYFRVKVQNRVVIATNYDGGAPELVTRDLLSWVLVRGYLSAINGGANIKLNVTDGNMQERVLALDLGVRSFFASSGAWGDLENEKINDYDQRNIDDNPAFGIRVAKTFVECYPRERKVLKVPVGSAGNYYTEPIKWVELAEYKRLFGSIKEAVIASGKFWPPEERKKTKAWSRLSVSFAPAFVSGVNELLVINNP